MSSRFQSTARTHAVILVAVFALLGQALFPHIHAWQAGDHGAAFVDQSIGHGERLTSATHEADHERAACPTCQALAQSRQVVAAPRPLTLTFVPVRVADPASRADALASREHAAPSAPRAPPVSA